MHNVFTTNIQGGVLQNESSETFKQNPWKIPKSNFFSKDNHFKSFNKVAGSITEFVNKFSTCLSRFLLKS